MDNADEAIMDQTPSGAALDRRLLLAAVASFALYSAVAPAHAGPYHTKLTRNGNVAHTSYPAAGLSTTAPQCEQCHAGEELVRFEDDRDNFTISVPQGVIALHASKSL